MGNIKGLQDPYRTPTTQKGFAEKWGQNPSMVTSFADGSKVNFEQAVVANATGMGVAQTRHARASSTAGTSTSSPRGTTSTCCASTAASWNTWSARSPSPGVFCLAEQPDPKQRHYLNLYKLGEGPLYSFYTPYHLCHFEVPNTIARVALFGDAAGQPVSGPCVEVCAVAKRDLAAGEVLDDYGHYMTYGEAVNSSEMRGGRYLPEGLVEGCRLRRPVAKDTVITYDDVELPAGRLADRLHDEQYALFSDSLGDEANRSNLIRAL